MVAVTDEVTLLLTSGSGSSAVAAVLDDAVFFIFLEKPKCSRLAPGFDGRFGGMSCQYRQRRQRRACIPCVFGLLSVCCCGHGACYWPLLLRPYLLK